MSDIPSKNSLEQKPASDDKNGQTRHDNPNSPSADFAALINAIKIEGAAYRREEKREDGGKKFREWITIGLLCATVVAIGWQVYEMVHVYGPIHDQAVAAGQQAEASVKAAAATLRAADATTKAADAAVKQSEIAARQAENSEKAVIQAQRAWVGPVDVKIVGAVDFEKPVKVVISIRNTGREPAKNFRWIPERFIAIGENDLVVGQKVVTSLKFCMGTPGTASGQVVFPSTGLGSGADYTIEFSKDEIDEGVIAGDKTLVVQGCIAYESFGVVRHSAFCYLFKNKTTAPEHLAICGGGSDAD